MGLSGHERKFGDVCGEEFSAQARRERRAYPARGSVRSEQRRLCRKGPLPEGSGTENDPFDGGIRPQPVLTGISITHSVKVATVTATNHGYATGNIIVVDGATGTDGELYNGTFPIYGVTQNAFNYEMLDTPGANASGSLTCTLDPYQFDAVMRTLQANTAVHLGPGTFETKGFSTMAPASWQPKAGQKFLGS